MSSPIWVNGSTTIISVRATNFTYDGGNTAVVLLSSINNLGKLVTIYDEDGYVNSALNRRIKVSTVFNVFFDENVNPINGGGDFQKFITQPNGSLAVYARTTNQWVLPQTVINSQLATQNRGITLSATDFNSLQAEVIALSTNLEVYGSTISGTPFTINSRVLTSLTQDSLTINGIQALQTSTGAVTVGSVEVDNINTVALVAENLNLTNFIQASSFSTFTHKVSSIQTRSLGLMDPLTSEYSQLRVSDLRLFWSSTEIVKETASTFSSALNIYSTSLPILNITAGLSSLSSFIPDAVSSIVGAEALSSYSTAFINYILSIDYGPGVSSLSTVINSGLSSIIVAPSLSTISTVISRGLSSVYVTPGISSLYNVFSFGISTVNTSPGLSSLSTAVSLGLSTVNATLAFSNVSTFYSFGVSDIAQHTGLSSLSSILPSLMSSIILQEGVSSISSYIFSTVSSVVVSPGLSSLSTAMAGYYNFLTSPQGVSSMSTNLFTSLSTQAVSRGLSTLSSVLSLGLSTVSVFGGLSTISTTFATGLFNVKGNDGISSLSTISPVVLSTVVSAPGASSLFTFIRNQFSTLSDQDGISSFSSFIAPILSTIVVPGTAAVQYPSELFTLIVNTCTIKMWDSTNAIYRDLNISANKMYIGTTLLDTLVVQSTSRSTIQISSLNVAIGEQVAASSFQGTSVVIDRTYDFGTLTYASTVSTGLLNVSSLTTSSISFIDGPTRPLALWMSNDGLFFNGSSVSQFSSLGTSSFSTAMFSGVSSLSNIMPMSMSNMSTALAIGASTVNYGSGVSTLSTLLSQVSTVLFFPGVSTNRFLASTAFVSTISTFGPVSSFLQVSTLLNASSIITSSVIACNANIRLLNMANTFVSSFRFVTASPATGISTVSTIVTGAGISTGNVTITVPTASTFASTVRINRDMYASTIVVSTIFLPNFNSGPEVLPLTVSVGTIWFAGSNIQNTGDPNSLANSLYAFSVNNVFTSSLFVSSLQTPTYLNVSQRAWTYEAAEITQSTNGIYNRTFLSSFLWEDPAETFNVQYFDAIQYSHDGLSWSNTNWLQSSIANNFGTGYGQPVYNGVYWLVGNVKNPYPNGDPDAPGYDMSNYNNSVMYSPNGLQYYALESNQFSNGAYGIQWNGQYWLAGDLYSYDTTAGPPFPAPNTTGGYPTIMRSFDGIIWSGNRTGGFQGQAYGFGWNGSMWVAVGQGSNVDISPSAYSNIQYSVDGINWSNAQGVHPTTVAYSVLFDGKKWIAGGESNNSFVYSYDGINWNDSGNIDSNAVRSLAYNGRIYVAGGLFFNNNFGLAWSSNGIKWNYDYNILTNGVYSVAWSGDRFVATGVNFLNTSITAFSYDGFNWYEADNTWRYIRFTATSNSGGTGNDYAMSRFYVTDKNGRYLPYGGGVMAYGVAVNSTVPLNTTQTQNSIGILYSNTSVPLNTNKYFPWLGGAASQPRAFIIDLGQLTTFDGYTWGTADSPNRHPIRWYVEVSKDYVNWFRRSDYSGSDYTVSGTNSYQGDQTGTSGSYFVLDSIDLGSNIGQGIGFSSNVLPALETTTLKVHTMSKGYIPLYLTSTNHWQVTPSTIIMNNGFTINKELGSDKRVGINTPYPQATLDIQGTMQAYNSTFFSSIVIGSSIAQVGSTNVNLFVPNFEVSIFGSTAMNVLHVGASGSAITRRGTFEVFSSNLPIINRGASITISSITSTLGVIGLAATFPMTNNNPVDASRLYWVWNNGPNSELSSAYIALSGSTLPFTGQHASFVSSVTQDTVSSFVGLITASDGTYRSVDINGNVKVGKDAIWSTEALPNLVLTTEDKQKAAFGVISDQGNMELIVDLNSQSNAYKLPPGFKNTLYGRLLINGVGDGAVWTTNINGNVSSGDYLCASVVPGHARVQDDPTAMYKYTVAKATMSCDFNLDSSNYRCETIDWNGSTFKRAFIGCTYHCG